MTNRSARGVSLALLLTAATGGACGSSSPATGGPGTSGAAGGGAAGSGAGGTTTSDTDAAAPTGCPKSALTVLFAPMYSAFDGMHTFQIPAVVNGLDPTQVEIDWSASDPSMVALEPDPTTGGVMITTQKAGTVSIIASAGSLCGSSLLTITAATPDDWSAGSARYNMGTDITTLRPTPTRPGMNRDAGTASDGGIDAACTSCHGDTASKGPFKTVQHTPEQTGGFSDDDLINIFEHGVVPKGGYFDTTIVSYTAWQTFHHWSVGGTEKGLVTYLRSLAPAAQTGVPAFGGRFDGGMGGPRDGGVREGGGMMREGGGGNREAGGGN